MGEWIQTRIWKYGGFIPLEAALAKEFRCARATANRPLRELAQEGFLEIAFPGRTRCALLFNAGHGAKKIW